MKSEWKDCKDELPEFYETVQIARWTADGKCWEKNLAWREPAAARRGGYCWGSFQCNPESGNICYEKYSADIVTHWRLPRVPSTHVILNF